MILPAVNRAEIISVSPKSEHRLLIISEGFEARSLKWIAMQPKDKIFSHAIICKYSPSKKDRFEEMYKAVSDRTATEPIVLQYNRFDPTPFELSLENTLAKIQPSTQEIFLDISVMSKMLILIIFHLLSSYPHKLRVIYSEPTTWSPSEDEFLKKKSLLNEGSFVSLSSLGIYNVVRTPGLSSIVMQDSPSLLIVFTSTNGQLVNALANEINPTLTCLINAKNYREPWREQAALDIQKALISGFPMYSDDIYCFELLDYQAVFGFLADVYRRNCYSKRIILSPTGGKMHAVACALIKNCCPDIHVEYPTPESYLFETFSSNEVFAVHEIIFDAFKDLIQALSRQYDLDG